MQGQALRHETAGDLHSADRPASGRHMRIERLGMLISLAGGSAFILMMTAAAICGAIAAIFGLSMETFRLDIIFPLVAAISVPLFLIGIGTLYLSLCWLQLR
jgi:hypothetical protein